MAHSLGVFEKGNYGVIPSTQIQEANNALRGLTEYQKKFEDWDTDTTINTIRDTIVANLLGFDLVNLNKHGFDAKKSSEDVFLEVKQCSFHSNSWGGTWNDTNEEKAAAFSDSRLFTAVALWFGANELLAVVYGQHEGLGQYLLERVQNKPARSRSTQSVSMLKLLKDYNFSVICPYNQKVKTIVELFENKNKRFKRYVREDTVRQF